MKMICRGRLVRTRCCTGRLNMMSALITAVSTSWHPTMENTLMQKPHLRPGRGAPLLRAPPAICYRTKLVGLQPPMLQSYCIARRKHCHFRLCKDCACVSQIASFQV